MTLLLLYCRLHVNFSRPPREEQIFFISFPVWTPPLKGLLAGCSICRTATTLRQKMSRALFTNRSPIVLRSSPDLIHSASYVHRRSVIYNFTNNMHTLACGPYTEYVCLILLYCCARVRGENDFFYTLLPSITLL